MKIRIAFTFDVTDITDESKIAEAAHALADVMLVQAEDGLWTGGSPDAEPAEFENEHVAALRPIDFTVEVPPVIGDTATITSTTGVRFLARLLRKGTRYGFDNCLIWDDERAGVEFYDTRYAHSAFGQFTGGRYYVETLLGTDGFGVGVGGLNLDTSVADWSIDAAAMDIVRAWLRSEV